MTNPVSYTHLDVYKRQDQTYHQIASQALAAADQAPQGWTVVERAIAPPTTKEDLQTGLRGLLGQ